ncbi:MAG: hypothetical protein PVF96_05095 [Candidatus Bathyarchaeota archaeon]
MKEAARKVKLSTPFDVEKIAIRRDQYFPKAYIIDLPLDSTPNHVWQDIFERNWKSSMHLWDRKLFVVGDKLRLVTTVHEFGEKLDWIEKVIEETNDGIDEYNIGLEKEEEVRLEKELKRQKRWDEKGKVELIKDILRRKYT